MSLKKNIFMSLIERVTRKAEKLDELCDTIPLEIEQNKEKRDEWNLWHNEWKKAWIETEDSKLTKDEIEQKRIDTSITTKYRSLN